MKHRIITHIKKYAYIVGVLITLIFGSIWSVSVAEFGQEDFPYDIQGAEYNASTETPTTDIASELIQPDTNDSTSLLQRLTDYFRLSGTEYDNPGSVAKATDYVKWILNILLGFVSFISLIMVIMAFYLIFFGKGEDAVGKARKILIWVAIALTIMWLSRFIASFFFDIYTTIT